MYFTWIHNVVILIMVPCKPQVCSQTYQSVSLINLSLSHAPFVHLPPPERPPPSLTLTPSSRQFFRGEHFSVQCPVPQTNSSGWMLRQFFPGRRVRKRVLNSDRCSPLGGAVSKDKSDTCSFTAGSGNSGLYWCEDAEGRSNAVYITVSCESCVTVG